MATEHRHHNWTITDSEPAPEGANGRLVTLGCTECDESRQTLTLRSDKEIQAEIDAYNDDPDAE